MDHIEELKNTKKRLRSFTRSWSPTDKIRQVELLQKRYFSLLEAREANGGRPVPTIWRKWKQAQDEVTR